MENNAKSTNSDEFVEETKNIDTVGASKKASIDPALIEELKLSQSLKGAVVGGFLGAFASAVVWAVVTAVTQYEIGYIAIAVGFLTGFMVRKLGHGFEKHFGYIGAIWSLLGCFVGNILAALIMISIQDSIPFISILNMLKVDIIISIVQNTFDPMDLLFYGIAVYEGYRFSFINKIEINNKLNKILNARNI